MSEPVVQPIGDSIFVTWPTAQVTLEFARVIEHRDTLTAEVSITSVDAGLVHWARVNLASTQGRGALVKAADEVIPAKGWREIIERSCRLVVIHLRTGDPPVPMVATQATESPWWIDQWMPAGEVTVLYGDGGTGKSLFALALAVAGLLGTTLPGPWRPRAVNAVLYLDWEAQRRDHEQRLYGLTGSRELIPAGKLLHRRMVRPLADDVSAVKGSIDREKIGLVICDSLGAACGSEPESADAAVRTLMALRSLNTTVLVIAHVSKASAESNGHARPYGSVYVQNLARSTIEARAADRSENDEGHDLEVSYYHRKANNGPLARSTALRWVFDQDGTITPTITPASSEFMGLPAKILAALRDGPKTVPVIAESVGTTEATARTKLNELENRTKVIRIGDGLGGRGHKTLWELVDRNRTDEPF